MSKFRDFSAYMAFCVESLEKEGRFGVVFVQNGEDRIDFLRPPVDVEHERHAVLGRPAAKHAALRTGRDAGGRRKEADAPQHDEHDGEHAVGDHGDGAGR